MKAKRQVNFELLRIVAMLMIIVLHYLNMGQIFLPYGADASLRNHVAGLIESFCIVGVNCYVLISGYFMTESVWKPARVLSLAAQVLFYSLLVTAVMLGAGAVRAEELSYEWLRYLFPLQSEHYWFASHYLVLYLLSPVLAAGVQRLDQKTLRNVLAFLLVFFSVAKTLIPVGLVMDHNGYDYGWFLCLFLTGAYLRRYGTDRPETGKRGLFLYASMCLLGWAIAAVCGAVERRTGSLTYYGNAPYTYNYFTVFLGSVGLFGLFRSLRIGEGRAADWIRRLAPCTFGVYLLHAHSLVFRSWGSIFGMEKVQGSWLFLPHMIVCVALVYLLGTAVDYLRACLFARIGACVNRIFVKRRSGGPDSGSAV